MKRILYLAALLTMASCGNRQDKAATQPMDPDFEPTEPHPFAERIEVGSGNKLARQDLLSQAGTLGSLIIEQSDTEANATLLRSFAFHDDTNCSGTAKCEYNDFNELTDLWIDTPEQRIHSTLQWDENGNLDVVSRESWTQEPGAEVKHTMQVIEYIYSKHSGYGNWYADMAETIGGPIAAALHAGLLGRAPWTLPEAISFVNSEIRGDMIGEQQTYKCVPEYDHDNNGRVISERLKLPHQSHTYTYKYN